MRGKIFTPDEANQMLPLVSRIVDDIVRTYRRCQRGPEGVRPRQAGPVEEADGRRFGSSASARCVSPTRMSPNSWTASRA